MRLAVVDVGTNTVRLLVTDMEHTLERSQRITRLGRGVDATRFLGSEPMSLTVDAVAAFVSRARDLDCDAIRIAGTSALRDAANAEAFTAAVVEATGLELEVLDGAAEGRFAYAGATTWLDGGPFVVCDIGGGSTELITSSDEVSVDVGSVRVRERYLGSDPPRRDDLTVARRGVGEAIGGAVAQLGLAGSERLVGVAGTITTLAALVLGLHAYEDDRVQGTRISFTDVSAWSERLNAMTVARVRDLAAVESGRADVLGAGVLVLDVVMRALGASDVVVSVRDILDGLVLDLADRLA